ncbi:DNA polymerase I [Spiroplasma endosymbiont of Labia minor]|uniref:DNA polymerase I n=1 Tax=Spiroplasma endosymbiont of Labia minor TaxID=3066305 RepID=UPI0030CD34EB
MKKILLVDGNSLLFKSFFGTAYTGNILKTSTGIPTNAVFAFTNSLLKVLQADNYYDVKIAFDKGKETFRHKHMPDYKAGRADTPIDLIPQFKIVREMLIAANIEYFELDLIEADDIIGTMVAKIENTTDYYIDILSTDKDMFQLISDKTTVIKTDSKTNSIIKTTKLELKNLWGISPNQVPDFKGISGDSSDNIVGVKGIGEKGAQKLLNIYSTLENIYSHIDELSPKEKEKFIQSKEVAIKSKYIATIKKDINLHVEFDGVNINNEALKLFFKKYEMKKLLAIIDQKINNLNIEKISNIELISKFNLSMFNEHNYIYLETMDANYHTSDVIGFAISNQTGIFVFDGANHDIDLFNWKDEKIKDEELQKFLLDETKLKYTYDIKKIITAFKNMGYDVAEKSFVFDFMLACYLIDANVKSTFANHVSLISNNSIQIEESELIFGKGIKRTAFIDKEIKKNYLGNCAHILREFIQPTLNRLDEYNLRTLYEQIELPLAFCLLRMEQTGVLIDKQELMLQTETIYKQLNNLTDKIKLQLNDFINDDFNIASPKQLADILFNKMKLHDESKKQSTDLENLQKIESDTLVIKDILSYRKLSKLYSTYLKGFEKYIRSDGRVHSIFTQGLTQTGRLASSDPNLQNIAIRDELQKQVRKIFITTNDKILLSLDYSQVELRMIAELAPEYNLIKLFNDEIDVHKDTATRIFNLKSIDDVTPVQRSIAKTINFSIIYGKTIFGLSQELNIKISDAKKFIDRYNELYPDVIQYKQKLINEARQNGFATTITFRRRNIDELFSENKNIQQFGERAAVNMPIQGAAADLLKMAMVNLEDELNKNNLNAKMISQIHDEIILEVSKIDFEKTKSIAINCMENAFKNICEKFNLKIDQKINFTVSTSSGNNWYELK